MRAQGEERADLEDSGPGECMWGLSPWNETTQRGAYMVIGQGTGRHTIGSDWLILSSSLKEEAGWGVAVRKGD